MPKETFADVSKPNLVKLAWRHLLEMHFVLVKTHDHRTQTSFCGFNDYWASIINQLRMHSFEVMHLISSSCDGKGTSATCRTNSQWNQQGPNRFQSFFAQHQKVNLFLVIKTKRGLIYIACWLNLNVVMVKWVLESCTFKRFWPQIAEEQCSGWDSTGSHSCILSL